MTITGRASIFLLFLLLPLISLQRTARSIAPDGPSMAQAGAPAEDDKDLLEIGRAPNPIVPATPESEIKIVSYNIRWRGGEDLRRLIDLLRGDKEIGGAAIIGLQEVDRNRKRTGNINTARTMAEALGMYYAWAAPPQVKEGEEEETGVVILSPYPMEDVVRIVLPHKGPGGRRRAAIGATLRIGRTPVRFYSVHAETRIASEKKMEQLRAVIEDFSRRPGVERAVMLGDFNTIKDKDVNACVKLFTEAGFSTPFPHDRPTWKTFIIRLKLDWIWLRNLQTTASGITRSIGLSDHWPLWVKAKL